MCGLLTCIDNLSTWATLEPVLNPTAPVPLYRQLAADLARRIQVGEYREGERLPSEPELAAQHQIGRPTVRQAPDVLVRKGLIERKRGSGTYVRKVEPRVDLFGMGGTIAAFKKGGFTLETRILEPAKLRLVDDDASALVGQQAYCLSRLGCLSGQPVLLEHLDFRADMFPGFDQVPLEGQSISELVERIYQRSPSASRQEFTIGSVSSRWALALEVSAKTPLLVVKRTLDFPGAAGGIHSAMYCRADRIQFVQTLPASAEMGVSSLC